MYPSTSLYIDPTNGYIYGCAFNNGTLDPEGDGGFFIARIDDVISAATFIFNMSQPVTSIQFNCNNMTTPSVLCVFTTTRTVIEYKMSDLSFHRTYTLDSNEVGLHFDPASVQVSGQNAMLYFHRMRNPTDRMVLQKLNSSGYTLQTSTVPYAFSFPYGTPVYDVAVSSSGDIYTAFTTMLNSTFSRGGTDIVVTKHSPSLQRMSSLVMSTIKSDNISRVFPLGSNSVMVVGVSEGVIHQPTMETNRQIFVAQFLYSDISIVSSLVPNYVMANESHSEAKIVPMLRGMLRS
ncbi:hypothetical protein BKA69DRAFT_891498 [Paraphysoderma sedebokerense]|nr:hypothetical protein BKA69DRAFT_891498 [Paraphysoderma sedebokerense]